MTTLTLLKSAGIAIDQAIQLIISKDKIDEALKKLNEAKICTIKMEQMINPPNPAKYEKALRKEVCDAFGIEEDDLLRKTRKREIVNARQVYAYLTITIPGMKDEDPIQLKKRKSCSCLGRHLRQDHATILHSIEVVMNYYDTEIFYKRLIDRIKSGVRKGAIEMPHID